MICNIILPWNYHGIIHHLKYHVVSNHLTCNECSVWFLACILGCGNAFDTCALATEAFKWHHFWNSKEQNIYQAMDWSMLLIPCNPVKPVTFYLKRKWTPPSNSYCLEREWHQGTYLAQHPENMLLETCNNKIHYS